MRKSAGISAIAVGDGANVAERLGQLTMPPTITMIRNTSEAAPTTTARAPCRAIGTRADTDPVVMTLRLYQQFNGNTVEQRILLNYRGKRTSFSDCWSPASEEIAAC